MGDWYLFTITSEGANSYYVNDQFIGSGNQGAMGNLQAFTLNGFRPVGGSASQTAFAEVRLYKSGMNQADVGLLYQTVKAKWGL